MMSAEAGDDEMTETQQPGSMPDFKAKRGLPIAWIVAGVLALLAIAAVFGGMMPAQGERDQARTDLQSVQKELAAEKAKLTEALKDSETLSKEQDETKSQLKAAVEEKEAALRALEEAQKELSGSLEQEIAAGDVLIKEVDGQLVVDVSDKLLFDKGEAEISDRGKDLLELVAKSMNKLPGKQRFQVGGHTDSQRVRSKELVERYPTNWELSTARATNVVRYLQEHGKVAGNRLVAAGFAQFQPVATNNTETGRQKNRRIEIILLSPPSKK